MTGYEPGTPSGPPPGWYGDPGGAPALRWWDGGRWTEHTQPTPELQSAGRSQPAQPRGIAAYAQPAAPDPQEARANARPQPRQDQQQPPQVPPGQQSPSMPPRRQPKRKSWPARHKVLTGLIAAGALFVIIEAASASNTPSTPAADTGAASSSASPSAAVSSAAASSAQSTPAAPARQPMTAAQQQAVEAAQSYLTEGQGFSKQGLLQQLTSSAGNGFTQAQAKYAINYLHPDWDAQAVDAAKGYMQMGGFSQASLIQQLTSSAGSGFTQAQAEYAVSKVGL